MMRLGDGLMDGFYYVYILVSKTNDEVHYSGVTRDLKALLLEHNRGKCPHTAQAVENRDGSRVPIRS
jgi:predicted GIY-YIG superfamily endonuclease